MKKFTLTIIDDDTKEELSRTYIEGFFNFPEIEIAGHIRDMKREITKNYKGETRKLK